MRRWILLGVGLAAGSVLLAACDKEPYATFWVNTAADLVDLDPGDGRCEATEGAGDCSLRAAVMEANAHPGAQHINLVADTTYVLTIDGADEDAAATGDLDIVEAVDIHGEGATIDASALATGDRVFDIDIAEGTVTVDEVTVTGGDATDGAGFRVRNGNLVVDKTTVSGNTGGAAIDIEAAAEATVSTSTVSGNTAGISTAGTATLAWSAITDSATVGVDVTAGLINLTGTIIAANNTDCVLASPVASGGYNIDSDTTCGLSAGTDQAGTDPQLGPLQDNGGPTATRLPAAAGPAVDVGGACAPSDQRGTPRETNGPCDTGPVEWDRGALLALGSPRNFLGTNDMMPESIREDVWLSLHGPCDRREYGDRITAISDANGASWQGCGVGNPSDPSGLIVANPDYDPDGYFYVIELDDGDTIPNEPWPSDVRIDLYHPAPCDGQGALEIYDRSEYRTGEVDYTFTVKDNSSIDPVLAWELYSQTFNAGDCAAEQGWDEFYTIPNPTEGRYFIQATPELPPDFNTAQGSNNFSIRAVDPSRAPDPTSLGGSWPCTGDPVVANADAPYRAECPAVFGYEYLGIYARIPGSAPTQADFFLADIDAEQAGRTLEVELFDAAEGAQTVEVLDPNGNPVAFTWEITCQDTTLVSETGPCTTGETEPPGSLGRGPATDTFIDVSGQFGAGGSTDPAQCTFKPWGCRNSQAGRYNDRTINIRIDLPTAIAEPTWFGGNTWYKVRYTVGGGTSDRTTWSARIVGDPNT